MVISKEHILHLLEDVKDPEIPVLNVVEMGIVRDVEVNDSQTTVYITPTYSGCPAMKTIEDEILDVLYSSNIENASVKKVYMPAWTTDWITEEAKQKLKDYGIAPPDKLEKNDLKSLFDKKSECPFCKSADTKLTSEFGSTACKSLHYCNNCNQPFEHFKCI